MPHILCIAMFSLWLLETDCNFVPKWLCLVLCTWMTMGQATHLVNTFQYYIWLYLWKFHRKVLFGLVWIPLVVRLIAGVRQPHQTCDKESSRNTKRLDTLNYPPNITDISQTPLLSSHDRSLSRHLDHFKLSWEL